MDKPDKIQTSEQRKYCVFTRAM